MTPEDLIDAACDAKLALSAGELGSLQQRAAEKQAGSGITGPAALGIYVKALFDLFKARVGEVHDTVVRIVESGHVPLDAERISRQVDAKIRPFLVRMAAEVARISRAPFSREEPHLEDVYRKLRAAFEIEVQIAASKSRPRESIEQLPRAAPEPPKRDPKKKPLTWALGVLAAIVGGLLVAYIKGCFPGTFR